jgi:hypothetical protein
MNIQYDGTGYSVTFDCGKILLTVLADPTPVTITVNAEQYNNATDTFEQLPTYPQDFISDATTDITYTLLFLDGIYKITIATDEYYLFNICEIIDCKVQLIKDTVCSCCTTDDCKAKAYYKLNEFNVLWITYLSLISQNLINFDFVQDSLIPYDDLVNIVEVDKIIARLSDLCNDCEGFVEPCPTCT